MITTIRLKLATKTRLAAIGKKGDTFEELVVCLLNKYEGDL